MEEKRLRLFKEVSVWKRIDDTTLMRYRCLHVLPDDKYFVKCSDYYYLPLDQAHIRQLDDYYLESLFHDALEALVVETSDTLEEAILKHEQEFEDFDNN